MDHGEINGQSEGYETFVSESINSELNDYSTLNNVDPNPTCDCADCFSTTDNGISSMIDENIPTTTRDYVTIPNNDTQQPMSSLINDENITSTSQWQCFPLNFYNTNGNDSLNTQYSPPNFTPIQQYTCNNDNGGYITIQDNLEQRSNESTIP